jgi:hypothetical protein
LLIHREEFERSFTPFAVRHVPGRHSLVYTSRSYPAHELKDKRGSPILNYSRAVASVVRTSFAIFVVINIYTTAN